MQKGGGSDPMFSLVSDITRESSLSPTASMEHLTCCIYFIFCSVISKSMQTNRFQSGWALCDSISLRRAVILFLSLWRMCTWQRQASWWEWYTWTWESGTMLQPILELPWLHSTSICRKSINSVWTWKSVWKFSFLRGKLRNDEPLLHLCMSGHVLASSRIWESFNYV